MELKKTEDGSHTIYIESIDETYHSIHGAIQEANHVFIKNGINLINLNKINILEVGFGTGLNAILTLEFALNNQININYTGIETNPLSKKLINKLNYINLISNPILEIPFNKLHACKWEVENKITPNFNLKKININVFQFKSNNKFDLIYYDAFGPNSQPEMWTKEIFQNLFQILNNDGIFVTYCAKGQVKRDLKSTGFIVNSVPGPPGKREMTIAFKKM